MTLQGLGRYVTERYRLRKAGWMLVAVLLGVAASASDAPANVHDWRICTPDGIALAGYDVVSYWQGDAPLVGNAAYETAVGELTYRFANAANRQSFIDDPGRYLPTYQGWCSTNLSMGSLACPDYTNFQIEEGRLLLFEQIGFSNGKDVWNADPLLHRRQADSNFQAFLGQ